MTENFTNNVKFFRMSVGYKIAAFCTIMFAIALPEIIPFIRYIDGCPKTSLYDEPDLIVFIILFIIFTGYFLISAFKRRIEILPDKIRDVHLFKTYELLIEEIKGFKKNGYSLLLLPKDTKKRAIGIANNERKSELSEWIRQNLTDLDKPELEKIRNDLRLGKTEEQRALAIRRAERWFAFISVLNITVYFGILIPNHLIWMIILFPFAMWSILNLFDNVLKFKILGYYSVVALTDFIASGCVLVIRANMGWNIIEWKNFWLPFSVLFIVTLCLQIDILQSFKRKKRIDTLVILFICVICCITYVYGAVVSLNGFADSSPQSVYQAIIIGKKVGVLKIKLSRWHRMDAEKEIFLKKSIYEKYNIGDTVDIVVRDGWLGIPWYSVR